MATNPLEEGLCCPSSTLQPHQQQQQLLLLQQQDQKPRPPAPEQALNCPRCNSTNTKFCYYNNYSLSQPRYFCKGCRRYWTKGGTLRNVPVGGGCRKNKRSSSSSSSSKRSQDQNYIIPTCSFGALLPSLSPPPPPLVFDPHALTLAFSALHKAPGLVDGAHNIGDLALGSSTGGASPLPPQAPGTFLDVLRTGFLDSSAGAFDDLYYYGFSGGHHGNGSEDVEEGDVAEQRASTAPFFEGGLGGTQLAAQEASCKGSTVDGDNWLFMGLQRQVNGGDCRGGIAVDPGRDYNWNGTTGSSNWHGLVNIPP